MDIRWIAICLSTQTISHKGTICLGHHSPGRTKFDMAMRSVQWQHKTDLDTRTQTDIYLE